MKALFSRLFVYTFSSQARVRMSALREHFSKINLHRVIFLRSIRAPFGLDRLIETTPEEYCGTG